MKKNKKRNLNPFYYKLIKVGWYTVISIAVYVLAYWAIIIMTQPFKFLIELFQ